MTAARALGCLVAAASIAAVPRPAPACSFGQPRAMIDPALRATDPVPPTFPAPTLVTVKRGQGPQGQAGCGQSATSCDDAGTVQITVAASDDQTATARIGYRLRVVSGTPPADLSVPAEPIEAQSGTLVLFWNDGATDDQEGIDVSLEITAIDGAGNESAPRTVRVQDGGSGGGCRLAARPIGGARLSFVSFAGILIVLAARRRRAAG